MTAPAVPHRPGGGRRIPRQPSVDVLAWLYLTLAVAVLMAVAAAASYLLR